MGTEMPPQMAGLKDSGCISFEKCNAPTRAGNQDDFNELRLFSGGNADF